MRAILQSKGNAYTKNVPRAGAPLLEVLMTSRKIRGFTLLELVAAVAVIFVLAVLAVPTLLTQVYTIRIRYSATDLSGELQRIRMEAVRKNSFYSLQFVAGTPQMIQVVDKNGTVVTSIPPAVMGTSVTASFGTGSGAPGESAFVSTLNFAPASSSLGLASFNSRGLPCMPVAGPACSVAAGQGFVFFLSGPNSAGGTLGWSAVVVTPSGRCQVWAYDGSNWTQQ